MTICSTPPPSPSRRGSPIGGGPKARRDACRLALAVAVAGEQADPRVPAPTELRPVLGFSRLTTSSYGLIERVVERAARAMCEAVVMSPVPGRLSSELRWQPRQRVWLATGPAPSCCAAGA